MCLDNGEADHLSLGTGHKVLGGGGGRAGRNREWVINFQADEKGWVTYILVLSIGLAKLKLGILLKLH